MTWFDSRNFALHLIKVGKLKRFKKVSSDLKTILMTDSADLRFCGFLSFEIGETCQSILILLRGKITWGAYHLTEKSGWGVESIMVSDLPVYRRNTTSVTL